MSEIISLDPDVSFCVDEDAKLVLAAQQNPREFKRLYQKWLARVYRYFYFRVGNQKDAEDLTSLVFLKVFEDLPHYKNRGCFSAWLFAIAHARVVDYYRRGFKELPLNEINPGALPDDLLAQSVHRDELRHLLLVLRNLSLEEQELIRLRFAAELSYQEIGQILNRKEDAVRKSISRLLERIQSQWEAKNE
ncbi:MAG: sigma-70 family RNA polymerase sigma factor [Anaerolineae bacterium]|nr:sigma-70 family RNA polymerase sigma factor [Anaerolineae bacterium]